MSARLELKRIVRCRNDAEYLRLLEAKRLAQVTPPAAVVVPPSPMKAPLPTYPPDSSLTTLATSQQLPTSTDTRGRSPPASTSRSSTSSSSDASRTSARTAHKRRTSLSPVTAMKTIVPEWQDPPPSDLPAAVEAPKPPSAGSSGASSTQSGLTFPVVKAQLKDKPLERSVPAGGKQTAQDGKRKSRKSPIPPAADSRKGKGRATTSTTAPPMPVAFEEEPPWDEDDSIEIAAGKGPTARQKMRVNPRGWEGIEDISACAEVSWIDRSPCVRIAWVRSDVEASFDHPPSLAVPSTLVPVRSRHVDASCQQEATAADPAADHGVRPGTFGRR